MKLVDLFERFDNSKSYFHGGVLGKTKGRPIFFTDDFNHASDFSENDESFLVQEVKLSFKKSANIDDLNKAIKDTGAVDDDVKSGYVDDESDFLFAPKVLAELKSHGFDSFIGKGVKDSQMIMEYVAFDISQVKVIKVTKVYEP